MAPVAWWVESTDLEAAGFTKGVPVRLAGATPDTVPPKQLSLYPGGDPVTVRDRGRAGATQFELSLKGVTRRRLQRTLLLYPTRYEQCTQVAGLFEPAPVRPPAPGDPPAPRSQHPPLPPLPPLPSLRPLPPEARLAPLGLPAAMRDRVAVPLQQMVPLQRESGSRPRLLIRLDRALPLLPGMQYGVYGRSGRLLTKLTTLLPLPPSFTAVGRPPARFASLEEQALAAAEALDAGEPVTRVVYRLYGFVWKAAHSGAATESGHSARGKSRRTAGAESRHDAPEAAAPAIDDWWVSPRLLERATNALARAARSAQSGMRQRDAAAVAAAAVPGCGAALAEALAARAARSGAELRKREGRYVAAGAAGEARLPPAARQLRREIERSGRSGYDLAHGTHPNTRMLVERLVEAGLAVVLKNGRAVAAETLDLLAEEVRARLGSAAGAKGDRAGGELHQRELAALWGLPRNSTRALVEQLVADGRLERASAVHVGLPGGKRGTGGKPGKPGADSRQTERADDAD